MNAPTGNLAHSGTNDTRLQDLMADVREFGREAALGRDSLPKLALKVAYAAASGVISMQKDADGSDDASRLYAEYIKADSKKSVHEHTAGGLKGNTSKLRQIVTAASMPTADFYNSINQGILKREEMAAAEEKVRPCYAMIVELARTQVAQADDLTDEQIAECVRKPIAADKDVEDILKAISTKLDNLIKGEKGPKCADQEIVDAHALVVGKLTAFMTTRARLETIAKARELGIGLAPEVTSEVMTNDELAAELAA